MNIERKKICFVMTAPSALRAFMADHIHALARHYDTTVCCNYSTDACDNLFDESVHLVNIKFIRKISPWQDIACLFKLLSVLKKGKFSSIHSVMPKTGLLSMIAAYIVQVPVRIHMFTGQIWVTRTGLPRLILKWLDFLIGSLATDLYADSPSQRDFLVAERVIRSGKVLCSGSVNGVDCERFKPDVNMRSVMRSKFLIQEDMVVFGFMGRLTRDKGIMDLVEAFAALPASRTSHLLLVGPDEEGIERIIRGRFLHVTERVHFAGYTNRPEQYYPAFDVFCIPSYREGFGSSVIEAAACGVPALASRIYGLTDAVVEGKTGLMHPPRDISEIRRGLEAFLENTCVRERMGHAARCRARNEFSTTRLVDAMLHEYETLFSHCE